MSVLRYARAVLPLLVFIVLAEPGQRIAAPTAAAQRAPRTPRAAPVFAWVANYNWATIDVFVVIDGDRTRLGEVEAARAEMFTLPDHAPAASEVGLAVELVGSSEGYETGPLPVSGGELIELRIENNLALSTVTVIAHPDGETTP